MHRYTISARLKNGVPELPLDPTITLPLDLIRCKHLWDHRGRLRCWPGDQWAFVRATVEPFLYATIDPEEVHYSNGLLNPRGTIRSQTVELTSVGFAYGPLPVISAYARFEMTFDRTFTDTAALYVWMEATDWLDWSTNFGWRFPDGNEWVAALDYNSIEFEILTD